MERASETELNTTGHGVIKQSGNTNEAYLQEVDSFHLLHPEIYQGGLIKKSNDSSISSESSHENMIEIVTGIECGTEHIARFEFKDDEDFEEHKDATLDCGSETHSLDSTDDAHILSILDVPSIQIMERNEQYNADRIPESIFASTEAMASKEWSATSNESLFSIHPSTFSYGGDQPLFLATEMYNEKELQAFIAPEMHNEKELQASIAPEMHCEKELQASIEPGEDKNIEEERKLEEKEPSQVRLKQPNERILNLGQDEAKRPNATMILLSHSPRSDESDGSDYSFAFPVLGTLHKGDGLSSRRGLSGYNHGLESSISRQQQPQQQQLQASPHKRNRFLASSCIAR
ncbi:hypothetical protein V2J09_003608 [Rumex salicifolius]